MGLNDGLVFASHFNNGTATDWAGSNDGTVNGATATTDKNGVSNQALDFDGSNDYVSLPVQATPGTDSYSVSIWVNPDVATNNHIWDYNSSSPPYLRFNTDGTTLYFEAFDGSNQTFTTTSLPVTSNWTHYVCVLDRTAKQVLIYRNGTLVNSASYSTLNTLGNNNNFSIGRRTNNSNYFDGKIDEPRIYNRALTEYEILQLYYGYDTEADSVNTLIEGQVAYYKMDGDVLDATSNNNDGTNNGSTDTTGKINNGREFNGSNQWIDLNNYYAFDNDSISFWFLHDSANPSSFQSILSDYNSGATDVGQNFIGMLTTGRVYIRYCGGTPLQHTVDTADNTWHHVVVSNDGSNVKLYVDGVYINQTNLGTQGINNTIELGRRVGGSNYWDGKLDEVGLWDRVLLSDEISELYNSNNGLQYPYVTPTGYPNKVNGISPSKVNGISVANISKINNS